MTWIRDGTQNFDRFSFVILRGCQEDRMGDDKKKSKFNGKMVC